MIVHARHIVRTVAAVLTVVAMAYTTVQAGIRLDGTEFQGSSQQVERPTTTAQGSRAAVRGTKLVYTFSQAVLAKGEITNSTTGDAVKIGLGYDFNAQNTTAWGCTCNHQGDLNTDTFKDAVELDGAINALFFNGPNPQDVLCPNFRLDLNCDGYTDAQDLNFLILMIFFNGPDPCQPCAN